ncbi:MAG: hypothetical protein ACR2OB_12480 [Solirubrobacteraceae bacterium]
MPADQHDPGHASGFSVEEDSEGGFRWSAFGPAGARHGHADARADAEATASAAEQELIRPTDRDD